ncbi:TPA: hypothetical protein ACQ2H2_000393 [Klebsiella pneumoniae]
MQDLKIEYRDGKLVELSIDGVSFFLHPPSPSVIQQTRRYQRSS